MPLHSFDEVNLFEVFHPDYPGQRLVACRNRQLAQKRAHTRESLLVATEQQLSAIEQRVVAGRLKGRAEIGLKVGEKINSRKMKKHFIRDLGSLVFVSTEFAKHRCRSGTGWHLRDSNFAGRTIHDRRRVCQKLQASMQCGACISHHQNDQFAGPADYHRTADRVRAHIFLCMLAYYVEWHMREAWRELLFADPHLDS